MILRAAALLLALALPATAQVPEPAGFRGPPYSAPVPATLAGATVIDGKQAVAMHARGVAFIDVYPRTRKPQGLPQGTIWREPRHQTIPGALWLWDTGYERLTDAEQARLAAGLQQASTGDRAAPLVIFCRADCWQSWNAGKRAVAMGYTGVHWIPGGTEAWQAASGAELVDADPVQP